MNEDCPHCVFEITEDNCRGCFEGSHYKPKPIANADRIRAMTDEELAKDNDFLTFLWNTIQPNEMEQYISMYRALDVPQEMPKEE